MRDTVAIKAAAGEGAASELCKVGLALAIKGSCGIITQKHLLGTGKEALGAIP